MFLISNLKYTEELYNPEIKEAYLSPVSKSQYANIKRFFNLSQKTENDLGIDLHDFNRDQLRLFFLSIFPSTIKASRHNVATVRRYIDWSIDEGYVKGINPLSYLGNDWSDKLVIQYVPFLTSEQMNSIISSRVNAQDRAIFSLIRNGVYGEECSEIVNLSIDDIEGNVLHLKSINGKRSLEVDDDCIKHCIDSYKEDSYEKLNGNSSARNPILDVSSNRMILRAAITRTVNLDKVDKFRVFGRINSMASELEMSYLNADLIRLSGILERVIEMATDGKMISREAFNRICNRYEIFAKDRLLDIEMKITKAVGIKFS